MTVAVVDCGTNSTRVLVADGDRELERESIVTRLGDRVDEHGRLREDAQRRVLDVIDGYRALADRHGCEQRVALMTSAVRDAANGLEFAARVGAAGFPGRILSGDEEARLTFAGATAGRDPAGVAVIDIGGGSTEVVTQERSVSTQIGVVRQSERHDRLEDLAAEVRGILRAAGLPPARSAIAVAGTPTSAAAIDLGGYDRTRVEGHRLTVPRLHEIRTMLAALTPEQRAAVPGLHPARAPLILPGLTILLEALAVLDLHEVEVSEHDILWGAARTFTDRGGRAGFGG